MTFVEEMKSSCPVQLGDNADLARMDPVKIWKSELDIQKNRGRNSELYCL